MAKMGAPWHLLSQSPSSKEGGRRRQGSASSGGSVVVLWVPGVSAHDLHIFQGFSGRELMFLFFLSFSLV